jgi:hypothetical protein
VDRFVKGGNLRLPSPGQAGRHLQAPPDITASRARQARPLRRLPVARGTEGDEEFVPVIHIA